MRKHKTYKVKCRDCSRYMVYRNGQHSCDDCKHLFDSLLLEAFQKHDPFETPLSLYLETLPLDILQLVETLRRVRSRIPYPAGGF